MLQPQDSTVTEESQANHSFPTRERLPWPIALTFVAGLLVSFCIYSVLRQWELDTQRLSFESRVRDYTFAIENDLGRFSSVLKGIGDSIQVYGIKDREQFKSLVTPTLKRHPSIHAISWDPVVSNGERPLFVGRAKQEGLDSFQVSERNGQRELVRASPRDSYVVVYFIEPLQPNKFVLGYDIASNSTRQRAITQAFQSGKMVATERIQLVQETGHQFGVLILVPIYDHSKSAPVNQSPRGLLVGVLRLRDVIHKALSRFETPPSNVQLKDISKGSVQKLLSDTLEATSPHDSKCENCYRSTFQFCQRTWQLSFHPNLTEQEKTSYWQTWLPTLLSLLFSFSVCFYLGTRLKHIQTMKQQSLAQELLNQSLAKEINERQRAESMQREGELYLRTIIENIPVATVFSEPGGQVKYVNKRFQDEFSKTFTEVVGLNVSELFSSDVHEQIRPALTKVKLGDQSNFEFKLKTKTTQYYAGTFVPQITDAALLGFITVIKNVTKEKKLAANQLQSQKLEALGTLAGGIAHEFNNLLTIILGNAKLHLSSLPDGPSEGRDYLESISTAGLKAKELGQQILTFSRREAVDKKVIDLPATIVSTLKLLSATAPSHITTKTILPNELCLILAAPTQIQQVLLNLCTNAYHAIDKETQGVITIECMKPDDKTVRLIVRDNGTGIPEHLQGQIFDPFFTTKGVGQGTGLGLAVVHGIIENHQAHILLESTEGQGCTFTMDFPCSTQPLSKPKTLNGSAVASTQNKHILIVEDEVSIRRLYKTYLTRHGFTVTLSPNGADALELFLENPERFDLVLTDQAMPKMTGANLSAQLLKLYPELPIILSTGFSESFQLKDARRLGIRECLSKPVDLTKLLNTINGLLQ